ncbi:BLUF domain-containing protein [Roseomonas sp. WA12]
MPTSVDPENLHRLIYCSTMDFDATHVPFTSEIQSILERSRSHNPTSGITGALMAGESRFAQVLEGTLSDLVSLYGRIARDRRHRDVLLLTIEPARRRHFQDWAMAYVSQEDQAEIPLSSRPPGSNLSGSSVSGAGVLALLRYVLTPDRRGD